MASKVVYIKTCPVCNKQFETTDSRVITDDEQCRVVLKRKDARDRYHALIGGDISLSSWKQSSRPAVKLVCSKILKALPASKTSLSKLVIRLEDESKLQGITANTLANCLTRLKLAKQIVYDHNSEVWVRVKPGDKETKK